MTENYPVYAVEHGLTPDEVCTVNALLSENFRASMRADPAHWLVWTAAAAEVGYRYDGTEYWDSFRETIPQWLDRNRDRDKIREFYRKFASSYRGLTPSGPWAGQFPIIAWPITQAILPKYLQRHFAEHLFSLRNAFARNAELTLDEIGDLLCERYYGTSSRFEGFLTQKALTARIVLALGTEGVADAIAPIEKSTLDRIAGDIDKLEAYRLREVRRVLRDARFINSAKPGFSPKPKQAPVAATTQSGRFERPRLIARPVGEDVWALSLAMPDLAAVLRHIGITPRDLDKSGMRFRVLSEGSAWTPGRGLFYYDGDREEPIAAYPSAEVAVCAFENATPEIHAIATRLLFPAQPLRLLKVHADGIAYELAGAHVRACNSYVLVSINELSADLVQTLGLAPLTPTASGAHLWRLDVPRTLDGARIAALKRLGLGYQLGVRVEPLGLSPRWSAATGSIALLDTETAMFCLTSDVAVREFLVGVDGVTPTRVPPSTSGSTLISIGPLGVGPHRITFAAHGSATGDNLVAETLSLDVRIAEPWQHAIEGKAGVELRLDPREAPLNHLLDDRARIVVSAPPRRSVTLRCKFYGADRSLFHEDTFDRCDTPVSSSRVTTIVASRLSSEAYLDHVERAARIEVIATLDECGVGRIEFEKEVEPLRWLRQNTGGVRLSDDSAEGTPPTILRYDLAAVDAPVQIDYEKAVAGVEVPGKGALFVATLKGRDYEALATTIQRQFTDFQDLGVPANLSSSKREPTVLLSAIRRWYGVRRMIGPMAYMGRANAMTALHRGLAASLCGSDWVLATDRVLDQRSKMGDLYSLVYYSRGFASGIARFKWQYESDESAAITEFARLLDVYKIACDRSLAVFALRLAFQPHALGVGECQAKELFDSLMAQPAVARGAYFARLAHDLAALDTTSGGV